jgi:hypothetical protein
MFPSFSLYNPFLDGSRQENVQKELRALRLKQEFVQLLEHCGRSCEGADLEQLLTLPCERLNEYSKLLTMFLSPKLRGISDDSVKRADNLIRFIRTMKYVRSQHNIVYMYIYALHCSTKGYCKGTTLSNSFQRLLVHI